MKKSERILAAVVLVAIGILFIILQDDFIGVLMTIVGVSLAAFGVVDICGRRTPQGIIKIVSGGLLVLAGWLIVEAVLYILAGVLLVVGILLLYDRLKNHFRCNGFWRAFCRYATPVVCIAIGILLLFHQEPIVGFVCVASGLLTALEGGLLLLQVFLDE